RVTRAGGHAGGRNGKTEQRRAARGGGAWVGAGAVRGRNGTAAALWAEGREAIHRRRYRTLDAVRRRGRHRKAEGRSCAAVKTAVTARTPADVKAHETRISREGTAMTTRRDFIKAAGASGIVFGSCAMRDVARGQGSDGQRLPVTVNGKRIKTIDVHAHCHFYEALALMGDEAGRVMPRVKGAKEHFIVIEERLKGMDAQAIDME